VIINYAFSAVNKNTEGVNDKEDLTAKNAKTLRKAHKAFATSAKRLSALCG